MTEPMVTMRHVRAMGMCAAGARAWCERHGVDWARVRGQGIPVSELRENGDAFALKACELAEEEARGQQ